MSQFIETIRIQNGRVRHIAFHNDRYHRTLRTIGVDKCQDLRSSITIPEKHKSGIVKCRIIYDEVIRSVTFDSYQMRPIHSLRMVDSDIDYSYKYADRHQLDRLFFKRKKCDDILIVKNGMLTDTYYCNIALRKSGKWYTPEQPLLAGTMRSYLIAKHRIIPAYIPADNINSYDAICIFNAMIPFGKILVKPTNIM